MMLKMLFPIFLTLFLCNAAAEDLDVLDRDLELLKSNLLLLSDKIALDEDGLAMLGHIDVLMEEVKKKISDLSVDRQRYEDYFSGVVDSRMKAQWNRRGAEFDLGWASEESLNESIDRSLVYVKDGVNNKKYLYDSVACPDQYSIDEWRQMRIKSRRTAAIRCTIEAERDEIAKLYSEYLVEDPELKGGVTMMFSINGNGWVIMKQSKSSLPLGLNTLIVEKFSKIKFPALGLSNIDLEYTFNFKP